MTYDIPPFPCVLSEWLSHFATIMATADAFYNEMREFFEKFIQCIRQLVNKKFIKRLIVAAVQMLEFIRFLRTIHISKMSDCPKNVQVG